MQRLLDIQASCQRVSVLIAEEHFHVEPWQSWTDSNLVNNSGEGTR